MKKYIYMFSWFLFCSPCLAQSLYLPDNPVPRAEIVTEPKPVHARTVDKKFLVTFSILGASAATDFVTTERNLDRGWWETNPLFGLHPSRTKLVIVSGSYFAGEVVLAYTIKRFGRHHWWGKLWVAEPAWQTADHTHAAWANAQLERRR